MDQQLARRLLAAALPMAGGSGDHGIEPLARFLLGVSLFLCPISSTRRGSR